MVFTPGSRFERTRNEKREFLSFNRSPPPAAIETADDRAVAGRSRDVVRRRTRRRVKGLSHAPHAPHADLAPFPAFPQIVCVNTAACLFAGRFGLAPTANKNYGGADSYGKMVEAERPPVQSRDPAGFTIVDVAARGSPAHILSAGEILAQKAAGSF